MPRATKRLALDPLRAPLFILELIEVLVDKTVKGKLLGGGVGGDGYLWKISNPTWKNNTTCSLHVQETEVNSTGSCKSESLIAA